MAGKAPPLKKEIPLFLKTIQILKNSFKVKLQHLRLYHTGRGQKFWRRGFQPKYPTKWEFLFLGGGFAGRFFGTFFPNIFSGSGQKYVMCIFKTFALERRMFSILQCAESVASMKSFLSIIPSFSKKFFENEFYCS